MSEHLSEQAAEIAALTKGINRLKKQRDEAGEALVVRERVLKARIAERDAVLGAVAALADGVKERGGWAVLLSDLRAVLAPVSGAVAKHEQEVRADLEAAIERQAAIILRQERTIEGHERVDVRSMQAQAWDAAVAAMVYEDGTAVEIVSITNPYRADALTEGIGS
jgi:hypothetical protein